MTNYRSIANTEVLLLLASFIQDMLSLFGI